MNEIVSTHGYSQNQIIVWRHPTMTKLATLTGHTMRVLYLATSPDGQTIVTGAGKHSVAMPADSCRSALSHGPSAISPTCGHDCLTKMLGCWLVLELVASTSAIV